MMAECVLEILKFKDKMGNLSNQSFKEVFENNKDFVKFTRSSMREGKGIFKQWIRYVKIKNSDGKSLCESAE
jgi:hypothetical protein